MMLCGAALRGVVRAQREIVLRSFVVISAARGVIGLSENLEQFISTQVKQFHEDCGEQTRCEFSNGLLMCQFHKDRGFAEMLYLLRCYISRSCAATVEAARSQTRLAGAALLGKVRVAGHAEASHNRCFGVENLQHWSRYFLSYHNGNVELMFGFGEGAPVHISEDAAWCCGPTLEIALLWRFEMARPFRSNLLRRDRECTGPRQLRQPKWRSARAGPLCIIFGDLKANVTFHASFHIISENISLN